MPDSFSWVSNCHYIIKIILSQVPEESPKESENEDTNETADSSGDAKSIGKIKVFKSKGSPSNKVSLLGVDSIWGHCTFIPADWGS